MPATLSDRSLVLEPAANAKRSTPSDALDLRALLLDMEAVSPSGSGVANGAGPARAIDWAYEEEDEAEAADLDHGRLHRTQVPSRHATADMELRIAEERVRVLEAQLLDAEETICHLKAEKLEAWRHVERLSTALEVPQQQQQLQSRPDSQENNQQLNNASEPDAGRLMTSPPTPTPMTIPHDPGEDALARRLRAQVVALETRLRDTQQQHAVERSEHEAVIREQERDVLLLRQRVEELQQQVETAQLQYQELLTGYAAGQPGAADPESGDGSLKPLALDLAPSGHPEHPGIRHPSRKTSPSWRDELVRHPTPHFDLDSPEVQYLLVAWTTDAKKRQYLRSWLTQVAVQMRTLPDEFPCGIELPRLSPEIRDGFLTLVVPLLRTQPYREIVVQTRQYNDAFHTDVRIRAMPREL